jgi:predicted DNA-binding protein
MAMTTTAVRFADEEREWIKSYAEFHGKTVSEVIREAVFEKLEDASDIRAYNEALQNDDGIRYGLRESAALYGIEL